MGTKLTYRDIVYNGKSSIRSTYNSLGTQMDDPTQHAYERYHSHEDYQLMYLQEGKAVITVDDVSHVYTSGDILLLGAKLPHKIEAYEDAPCKGILIQFRQSLFPKEMQDIGDYHLVASLLRKSMGGLLFHTVGHQALSVGNDDAPFLICSWHSMRQKASDACAFSLTCSTHWAENWRAAAPLVT